MFYNIDDEDRYFLYGAVSEIAVSTVMKCLGIRQSQYEEYKHIYQVVPNMWFMNEYNKVLEDEVRPYFKDFFKHKKPYKHKHDVLSSISNDAVCTVLKALGLSGYNYDDCWLMYRDFKWVGMSWYLDQYNNMLRDKVRPYYNIEEKPYNYIFPDADADWGEYSDSKLLEVLDD